jgi:selenocysteine lyase/cysteine desulfurase
VFGNPHSHHNPSRTTGDLIERARAEVLRFLDADPSTYVVCFTASATAAIKLVAESYPFAERPGCVLSADNHNSVNGIREYARRGGAKVEYLPLGADLRLLEPASWIARRPARRGGLFAYPAQSNFSGVKHSLALVDAARAGGFDVLLDAAAYLPAGVLSLRACPADFVVFSFYKLFGYPTGVGALVARQEALDCLQRPWFAGGTVEYASVQADTHRLRPFEAAFEDGTLNFLAVGALLHGFALLDRVGIPRIGAHVARLRDLLLHGLMALRHDNGVPLVRVYGPGTTHDRGGTIAFNVVDRAGLPVPHAHVEKRCRDEGVSVRGGCFCNPGASEAAFGFEAARAARCFATLHSDFTPERFAGCLGPEIAGGAVRASIGMANNAEDIRRCLSVVASFRRQ